MMRGEVASEEQRSFECCFALALSLFTLSYSLSLSLSPPSLAPAFHSHFFQPNSNAPVHFAPIVLFILPLADPFLGHSILDFTRDSIGRTDPAESI
jgi:hypothetical protein